MYGTQASPCSIGFFMKRTILTILSISCFTFALTGCSKTAPVPESAVLKEINSNSNDPATVTDVSKEQAEEFAKHLETAIENGDAEAASELILFDRMLNRIVLTLNIPGRQADSLRKTLADKNPITATFSQVAAAIPDGGSYKLVRTAVRGDEMHAIFRMLDSIGRMNYHDYRLVMDQDSVKSDQMFIAATGQSFADSLTNILRPAVMAQQSSISRITGDAAERLKELEQQSQMLIATREGNAKKALAIYKTLPQEIKESKVTQLSRLMALQSLSEEEYLAAMTEYTDLFPDDPSVALMALDKAVLNEDVAALRKCYTDLNKWNGGDDYLSLMTAALVSQWGDTEYAKDLYEGVDAAKLGIPGGHNFKMVAALFCKDYPVVAEELQVLQDEYAMGVDLESDPDFEGFKNSPSFADFKAQ